MAASSQPVNPDSSLPANWQTLVRDHRYRLFAAGSKRATIAECLQAGAVQLEGARPDPGSFDARYGLMADTQRRLVLLTQVCRAARSSTRRPAGAGADGEQRSWRWVASHSVEPIARLAYYIDRQARSAVLFLTRSAQSASANTAAQRERLEDSALQIGRGLGLPEDNVEALRVAGLVHAVNKVSPPHGAGGLSSMMANDQKLDGERCQSPECTNRPAARLDGAAYCKEHFISTCYARLDVCGQRLVQRRGCPEETETMRSFLSACIEQATALTRNPFRQDALERARLLDILYTASDLSRRMRRSSRLVETIPVRLLCETPGRPWLEEMSTVLISRHGAMLECEHFVKPEDWLSIERADTGRRVRARMAWRGPAKEGHFALGLEFLESENFWGLSWTDA